MRRTWLLNRGGDRVDALFKWEGNSSKAVVDIFLNSG